jgi:predicted ATP-dependent protease
MIPAQNLRNLMLREEVIEAVRAGTFTLYAVRTVDEGLEVLTGVPAGEAAEDGTFPDGTVNHRVSARLGALAERLRKFTPAARVADAKPDEPKPDGGKPDESSSRKDG